MFNGIDIYAVHNACFICVFSREKKVGDAVILCTQCHGKSAVYAADISVKAQLTCKCKFIIYLRYGVCTFKDAQHNRYVKNSTAFTDVGRGKIYGYPGRRIAVVVVLYGRTNPFPGLFNGVVAKAYNVKCSRPPDTWVSTVTR